MSSIFSAISGHLTRSLVFGTLLPVLVFVVGTPMLFSPLLPRSIPVLTPLHALDKEWIPLSLVMTTVAITGLLYNLNTSLIRLYEGYTWKETPVGQWRIRRYRARVERLVQAKERLILLRGVLVGDLNREARARVQQELGIVARELGEGFPAAEFVLPTRFGNVIRSFEEYSRLQYGMSAIPLWPRMAAVVNKDYAALIDDAKSAVDFAVNASFLSGVLAACLLATGIVRFGRTLQPPNQGIFWILSIGTFVGIGYVMYLTAIARAAAWGVYVKGAFDLYRRDLLKALSYQQEPSTISEERELWKQVSRQLVFGDPLDGAPLPFKDPSTAARLE